MSTRTRRPRPPRRPTPRTGSLALVPPLPVHRTTGGTQEALFGEAVAQTSRRPDRRGERPITDVDLLATVLRMAIAPGYLLCGPAERVVRRDDIEPDNAVPVPVWESDTVAQLLDSGHLRLGTPCRIADGPHCQPAVTVLVPTRTRRLLDRWTTTGLTRPR